MDDEEEFPPLVPGHTESKVTTVAAVPPSSVVEPPLAGSEIEEPEADSPPPTKLAHRLRDPVIKFVFDDSTGDFLDAYPTIFLSRPPPASQESESRRSNRAHVPPPSRDPPRNPPKITDRKKLGSTSRDQNFDKGKDKVIGPPKRTRPDEDDVAVVDSRVAKKLKTSKGEKKAVAATPAIRKHGPGFSKLPPVSLGVSGGGFGERVPKDLQSVDDGIESIGVLVVEEDLGDFVQVDGRLWNKQVAPFVGERVSLFFLLLCFY